MTEELLVGRWRLLLFLHGLSHRLLGIFALNTLAVLNDIVDAQFQFTETERFLEILIGTCTQSFFNTIILCLCRQQDDWQVVVVIVRFYRPCQLITIHLGHHHVGDYQIEFLLVYDFQGFDTVICFEQPVIRILQIDLQSINYIFLVITNKDVVHVFTSALLNNDIVRIKLLISKMIKP